MTYHVSKIFWIFAAPTNALILISAIAAICAVLRRPTWVTWLAAAVACGLVIGTFTPIGLALTIPLENRFPFSPPDLQAPDGIILLGGGGIEGIDAMSAFSRRYPKARLIFSGYSDTTINEYLLDIFGRLGGDPARIYRLPEPRTTSEDALYSSALLKPKPSENWLLVTSALHMPRAVGSFRTAGFHVKPHPVEFISPSPTYLLTTYSPGSKALLHFDTAAKEWVGLVAYWLMGKTDALFPGP
jgi:uncharacterized SAM-binding protein YcdF (DUF218 family)